jgi:hypothetical protein
MSGLVVVLCGVPGVGKGTVGRALAGYLGATFVENHAVNEIVFRVAGVQPGGEVPSDAFFYTARMQELVREMVARIAPPGASFVFTHTAFELPAAYEATRDFEEMAASMGARFLSVTLHCERDELGHRIASAERRERLKLTDLDVAWGPHDDRFIPFKGADRVVDTTRMSPAEAAGAVAVLAAAAKVPDPSNPRGAELPEWLETFERQRIR